MTFITPKLHFGGKISKDYSNEQSVAMCCMLSVLVGLVIRALLASPCSHPLLV